MAYKFIPPGRKNWYIAFPGDDGKEQRISTGTDNREAAENILSKIKVELAEGRFLDKKVVSTMTLEDFGKKLYLPRMDVAKPRSKKWRRERWDKLLAVLGKGMTLDRANRIETVEQYVDKRLGAVSLATVKEDVAIFRHALRLAVRWKGETGLEDYRLYDWRPPEDPRPPLKPEPVDPDDWAKILEHARRRATGGSWGARHGLAVILLARTLGARRGEILRLTRADVDLRRGLVNRLVLKRRVVGERRETRIDGEALELLREIAGSHEHDLIFANPETGAPRTDIAAFWKAVRKDAKVKAKFHGLRHAFGRDYLAAGHQLRELQERLGHSSIRTTEKYSHLEKRTAPPKGLPIDMPGVRSPGRSQGHPKKYSPSKSGRTKSTRSRGNVKGSASSF